MMCDMSLIIQVTPGYKQEHSHSRCCCQSISGRAPHKGICSALRPVMRIQHDVTVCHPSVIVLVMHGRRIELPAWAGILTSSMQLDDA